jgi:hypothetical protein
MYDSTAVKIDCPNTAVVIKTPAKQAQTEDKPVVSARGASHVQADDARSTVQWRLSHFKPSGSDAHEGRGVREQPLHIAASEEAT